MAAIKTTGEKRIKQVTNLASGHDGDPTKFATGDIVYYKPASGTESFKRRNDTAYNSGSPNHDDCWTSIPLETSVTNVIAPFAYAFVNNNTSGTGTGMSYAVHADFNASGANKGRIDFTFDTAQPDSNYSVVTDKLEFDSHQFQVSPSSRTTTGFTAYSWEADGSTPASPATWPGTVMVYGSTPTVGVFGNTIGTGGEFQIAMYSSSTQVQGNSNIMFDDTQKRTTFHGPIESRQNLTAADLGGNVVDDPNLGNTQSEWSATGSDWTLAGGKATYDHVNGGTQVFETGAAAAALDETIKPNRYYKLVVNVSNATGMNGKLKIAQNKPFAAIQTVKNVGSDGDKTIFAKTGDSVQQKIQFYVDTGGGTDTIEINSVQMNEIISGDVVANGNFTGGGTDGIKIEGDGAVSVTNNDFSIKKNFDLRLYDNDSSHYVALRSGTRTSNTTYILPDDYGSDGQVLATDASNPPQLSWVNQSTGGTPGGASTQIQYNNSGAFAGSADLTWDNGNKQLFIDNSTDNTKDTVLALQRHTNNKNSNEIHFRGGGNQKGAIISHRKVHYNYGTEANPVYGNDLVFEAFNGNTTKDRITINNTSVLLSPGQDSADPPNLGNVRVWNLDHQGAETLSNSARNFTGDWTAGGNWTLNSGDNKVVYNGSSASILEYTGTFTGLSGNRWYVFEYEVDATSGAAADARITADFAVSELRFDVSNTGPDQFVYFKSKGDPSLAGTAFKIKGSAGNFTLKNVSLKEIIGGDLEVVGTLHGGGGVGLGIEISGQGMVSVGVESGQANPDRLGVQGHVGIISRSNNTKYLKFYDQDNSNYVGFKAPNTVNANKIWELPAADGAAGEVLKTNGSGVLSWVAQGGTDNLGNHIATQSLKLRGQEIRMGFTGGSTQSGGTISTQDSGKQIKINPAGAGANAASNAVLIGSVGAADANTDEDFSSDIAKFGASSGTEKLLLAGGGFANSSVIQINPGNMNESGGFTGNTTTREAIELRVLEQGGAESGIVGAVSIKSYWLNTAADNPSSAFRPPELRFYNADGANPNYIALKAPSATTSGADYTLTLPEDAGSNNQVLQVNATGALSWVNQTAQRAIHDSPSNGATTTSISSNWAHDHNAGTGNGAHIPSAGTAGQFLKHDGTWGTPPDTNTQRAITSTPNAAHNTTSISSSWAHGAEAEMTKLDKADFQQGGVLDVNTFQTIGTPARYSFYKIVSSTGTVKSVTIVADAGSSANGYWKVGDVIKLVHTGPPDASLPVTVGFTVNSSASNQYVDPSGFHGSGPGYNTPASASSTVIASGKTLELVVSSVDSTSQPYEATFMRMI